MNYTTYIYIGKAFLLPLMAWSFMWISSWLPHHRRPFSEFSRRAFPTQWSFGTYCVFLSSFGSKWDCVGSEQIPSMIYEWYIFKRNGILDRDLWLLIYWICSTREWYRRTVLLGFMRAFFAERFNFDVFSVWTDVLCYLPAAVKMVFQFTN